MSFGGRSASDPSTLRGRDWPCLRQFGVFLENRVGLLNDLLRHLERDDLRVIALSIVDTVDSAIARLILSNYDHGKELFELSSFSYFETDVVGVELPDEPQPYVQICTALMQAEVNIHYSYPLLYRRRGRGAIAMYVDDVDTAIRTLNEKELTVVTEGDLLQDDEQL